MISSEDVFNMLPRIRKPLYADAKHKVIPLEPFGDCLPPNVLEIEKKINQINFDRYGQIFEEIVSIEGNRIEQGKTGSKRPHLRQQIIDLRRSLWNLITNHFNFPVEMHPKKTDADYKQVITFEVANNF
jgi:hypothetical protein